MNWIESFQTCPDCNNTTEKFCDDEYEYAERCQKCKRQINFFPNVHKVPFGTRVDTESI